MITCQCYISGIAWGGQEGALTRLRRHLRGALKWRLEKEIDTTKECYPCWGWFWSKRELNCTYYAYQILRKMLKLALTELGRIWFETSDRDIYITFQVSQWLQYRWTPTRGASDSTGRRKDMAKPGHHWLAERAVESPETEGVSPKIGPSLGAKPCQLPGNQWLSAVSALF